MRKNILLDDGSAALVRFVRFRFWICFSGLERFVCLVVMLVMLVMLVKPLDWEMF